MFPELYDLLPECICVCVCWICLTDPKISYTTNLNKIEWLTKKNFGALFVKQFVWILNVLVWNINFGILHLKLCASCLTESLFYIRMYLGCDVSDKLKLQITSTYLQHIHTFFHLLSNSFCVQQTLHMKLHIMCAFTPCQNSFEIKSSTTILLHKMSHAKHYIFLRHDTAFRQ